MFPPVFFRGGFPTLNPSEVILSFVFSFVGFWSVCAGGPRSGGGVQVLVQVLVRGPVFVALLSCVNIQGELVSPIMLQGGLHHRGGGWHGRDGGPPRLTTPAVDV